MRKVWKLQFVTCASRKHQQRFMLGSLPLCNAAHILAAITSGTDSTVTPRLRGTRSATSHYGGAIRAHMLGTLVVPRKRSTSNLKLYTDRMQERSVPQSKQVEDRLPVCAGSGCWVQCPQKKTRTVRLNPRRLHCIRLHANICVWACSIVVHQLHEVLAVADSLHTCRYSLLLDPPRFMLFTSSRPCASHSGQLVHRIWGIPRNLAHRIRVTLTPSLETRITTSLRLLCCVFCCRICSDVSRWWQMSNVCRKSGTLTRRNILKEDKSEVISLHVAFTRLILLACTCRGPWNRSFRADQCDA